MEASLQCTRTQWSDSAKSVCLTSIIVEPGLIISICHNLDVAFGTFGCRWVMSATDKKSRADWQTA